MRPGPVRPRGALASPTPARTASAAARAALPLVAALAVGACDLLLTEPAPPVSDIAVSFSVQGAAGDGVADAFDRVNRAYLLFVRPDSASRDTVVRVLPRDGEVRVRLALQTRERVSALGVFAQLLAGPAPVFEGSRVIRVEVGTPTSVQIPLEAVAARVRAERPTLLLHVGDTVRLASAVLFATGDTIPGLAGAWTSESPDVLPVTPAGLALGRKPGDARLLVRHRHLADTVLARVLSR